MLVGDIAEDSLTSVLDEAQREGVLAGFGLVPISAGAGTGKTRVLTTRIVRLVQEGEDPRSIVAVTFTNKAAKEMRERAAGLGGDSVAAVRFSTMHKLASRILRRHWEAAGIRSPDFLIADDDDVKAVLGEALLLSGVLEPVVPGEEKEHAAARRDSTRYCSKLISGWKENGLRVADVLDPHRRRRSQGEEAAATTYVAYQAGLAERNMVDFADLTSMAVAVMEDDPEVCEAEASVIRWLMVDEFQDTNPVQLRLLRLLTGRGANLTVVGDDDQSIYSFRRAVPNLMARVDDYFPGVAARGVTRVSLVTNRRCTDEILGHANLLVDYNRRISPKVLRSGRSGCPVAVSGHPNAEAEADDVARRVSDLIDAGTPPGEIAVLARVGDVLTAVSASMARLRVPHAMQAGTSFLERAEVMDILAYLKLAVDPSLDLAFLRIHARPTRGIGASAVEAVLSHARNNNLPIYDALYALSAGLKGEAKAGSAKMSRNLEFLAEAARLSESSEAMVRYVLEEIGYSDWAWSQKEPAHTLRSSIEHLLDNARAQPDFRAFLEDCSLMGSQEERAEGAVHLGTLHGSKGLEWDSVFLVAFEEGIIPSQRAMEEADQEGDDNDPWSVVSRGGLEEERRLAHVGLTRARHTAHVSFALRRRRFGRDQDSKPSRLLREAELEVPKVKQSLAMAKSGRGGKAPAKQNYF